MRRLSSFNERLALGFALVLVSACSSGKKPSEDVPASAVSVARPAPPASASAASSATALRADAGARDGGPAYEAGECSDFEPSRWQAVTQLPNEQHCWVFTPESNDKLPRPIVWEPCDREEFGPGCQRLKLGPREEFYGWQRPTVLVRPNGTARILTAIDCKGTTSRLYTVHDADGPTLDALAVDTDYHCALSPDLDATGLRVDVIISDDAPPETGMGTMQVARKWLIAADGEPSMRVIEHDDRGTPSTQLSLKDDPSTRDALRLPTWLRLYQTSYGADAKEMVWSFQENKDEDTCLFLRGPRTADAAAIAPTQVTRIPCRDAVGSGRRWLVGCSFAALETEARKTTLVRLKDGMTFAFPKLCAPLDDSQSCTTTPLALTCKHVYLWVGGPKASVYRIPFDGLPKGKPADEPPHELPGLAAPDAGPSDAGLADAGK